MKANDSDAYVYIEVEKNDKKASEMDYIGQKMAP